MEKSILEMVGGEKHLNNLKNFMKNGGTFIDTSMTMEEVESHLMQSQKENSILKNIISEIIKQNDICYICQMKGQVLPACKCMEDSECLENMISLWSKTKEDDNKDIIIEIEKNTGLKVKEYCKGYEAGYNAGKEDLQMLQTEIDRLKKNGKTN